jgi:bacillithiol synthase
VLRQALEEAERHEEVLVDRSRQLTEAGYETQVGVMERATNVFVRTEAGRERVYRRGADFGIRDRGPEYSRPELLAALEEDPARFSPNVLLRPVVESSVFPTLGYVGGPSEIAYFAQVNALFAELGILPPAVVPRFSATVIEPHVERVMESLRVTEDDLTGARESVIDRLARRETPPDLQDSLARLREAVAKEFESLMESAAEVDATLPAALGAVRNRALLLASGTERKILRAIKRGDRLAIERLDRVLNTIRPRGVPQERLLNVMPLLARYSSHFLREVELAIGDSWRFPEDG